MNAPSSGDLMSVYASLRETGLVTRLLELARDEDLGPTGRDLTSELFIGEAATLRCAVVARTAGVVAGLVAITDLLEVFGAAGVIQAEIRSPDGSSVAARETVATLEGRARSILTIERTLLNLLGRLSGVATTTRGYLNAMGDAHAAGLYDTRKTTPGLRVLEKYAVRCGGGRSHRLGLHDAVLIKDNHLAGVEPGAMPARLREAAERARAHPGGAAFVEVEVDALTQFEQVVSLPVGVIDIVLLDNFALDDLRSAVALRDRVRPGLALEASGGVRLDTIRAIAETGVDRISVGALTHSAVAIDFGLDAV